MAIAIGGINGPFVGKIGNIYGSIVNGKNVIKSKPRKSAKNKRGSVAQRASRAKFIKLQHFLHPILPFIRVGFNMHARSRFMSAHNAAKSYNMLHAFNEEGEIDFAKVVVSFGNLPGPVTTNIQASEEGIQVSWTNEPNLGSVLKSDQVMLLAYIKEHHVASFMLSGARRTAGQETLTVDKSFSPTSYHVWMAFISDDRQRISMSSYLGEIEF